MIDLLGYVTASLNKNWARKESLSSVGCTIDLPGLTTFTPRHLQELLPLKDVQKIYTNAVQLYLRKTGLDKKS